MVNISQSLGMPCLFLRYNPDSYKINGVKQDTVKSTRHKKLLQWLKTLLELPFDQLQKHGFLSVIHLYFDEYNPRKILWETILDFE